MLKRSLILFLGFAISFWEVLGWDATGIPYAVSLCLFALAGYYSWKTNPRDYAVPLRYGGWYFTTIGAAPFLAIQLMPSLIKSGVDYSFGILFYMLLAFIGLILLLFGYWNWPDGTGAG